MTRPKRKNSKPPKLSDSVGENSGVLESLSSDSVITVTKMPVKRSNRATNANKAWETLIPKSRDNTPAKDTTRGSKSTMNTLGSKVAGSSEAPSKARSQKKSAPIQKVVSAPAILKGRGKVTETVTSSPVLKKNNRSARSNGKETETVVLETKRGRTRSNLREPDTSAAKDNKGTPKILNNSPDNAKKVKITPQTVQAIRKDSPAENSKQSKSKGKETKTPDKNITTAKKKGRGTDQPAENTDDRPDKSEEVELACSEPRRGKSRLKEKDPRVKDVSVSLKCIGINGTEGIGTSGEESTSKEKVDHSMEEHFIKKSTRGSRSASKSTTRGSSSTSKSTPRGNDSNKSSTVGKSASILTPVTNSYNQKSTTGKSATGLTPGGKESRKISRAEDLGSLVGNIPISSNPEDGGLGATKIQDKTPNSVTNPRKRKSRGEIPESKPDEPMVKKVAIDKSRRAVAFDPATKITKSRVKSVIKAPPKKSLCNMDILGLLDDGEDDGGDKVVEEITEASVQGVDIESSEGQNGSLTRLKEKVPIWKKNAAPANSSHLSHDVFNPENYGEEEFGPEDLAPKKKRVRKKKKDTKAILVFGKTQTKDAKKVVKESHNLNTPGDANKKTKRVIPPILSTNPTMQTRKNIPPLFPTNPSTLTPQVRPVPETSSGPMVMVTNYTSDVSTGAQNYFDSEIHQQDVGTDFEEVPEQGEVNRSGAFGTSLLVPKSYKTPAVPRKISRLQTKNVSTPNTKEQEELGAKVLQEASIKELIKKNFGFDDTTDDDTDEGLSENDISMSPVKNVTNPSFAMFSDSLLLGTSSNRLSNAPTNPGRAGHQVDRMSSRVKIINKKPNQKDGPFRFNLEPARNPLLVQVEAMRRRQAREQEKGRVGKGKKLTKKAPKHKTEASGLEQSSLYEDLRAESVSSGGAPLIQTKLVLGGNRKEDKKVQEQQSNSDKENGDNNNTGDKEKKSNLTVSRTYTRKNTSTSNNSTLGQTEKILKTPKKQNKQTKKADSWAQLQTSHFSEVDDFDLSFG